MKRETINRLRAIVGQDQLTTTAEDLLCYSYDGTGREFPPEAVAFPGDAAQISAIMKLANATPFAVVPRGAGSGMTGGALPVAGGLVLAMSRLNRILEIDEENQVAVVEPGVITGDFQAALRPRNLFYPPDPASLKFCTLGGNVAECAGGPSAVKYGVTRDYLLGLEVVMPDGRIIKTGVRTAKGVVGYDLTRLFAGSEGTLGIITKIIVKLIPLPACKDTFLILCSSINQAASLVAEILAQHRPCTLEYMDRTAISIVRDKLPFPLPPATEALLLLEVDGDRDSVAGQSRLLLQFLRDKKNILEVKKAENNDQVAALWSARRGVSPAAFELKPDKTGEDVVVPRSKIPQLVAFIETLAARHKLVIFTFGHAGDGNIHVNIMLDKKNTEELESSRKAKKELFDRVLELGGTLSGEHGIGITKSEFLPLEINEASMEVMLGIKKLFDPNNILNPGKIFPTGGQSPMQPKNNI
ncbi:MAG: glycolate oxidase subunit GlcD [Desulfobulbaceae bacterium DB1]|nr:MAG: glycolate oxidase subunit GlcD [Desulfobulbaceae bacterium DB1]